MLRIVRTDSTDPDFINLVKSLDAYLAEIDGDEHAFYAQLNKTDTLKNVVLVYEDNIPVGCGAFRAFENNVVEVKRMYTVPDYRGKGFASMVLSELEKWAEELLVKKCVLETGHRQPEAINLYKKQGYKIIPNYGKYAHVENSVCFEKNLNNKS